MKYNSKNKLINFRLFQNKKKKTFIEMKPVLVIGAGLSAADAVSICRSSGIKVIHVYRNRSAGLDKMLPETVYPEYHEVNFFLSATLAAQFSR